MPINKAYNIESVIKAVKEFPIDQRKRVMFEYLMIKDLQGIKQLESFDDINKLVKSFKLFEIFAMEKVLMKLDKVTDVLKSLETLFYSHVLKYQN